MIFKVFSTYIRYSWCIVVAMTLNVSAYGQTCALTLKTTVSGCYANNGSKATVSVEVAWENANVSNSINDASDAITVTLGGQTRTINPGAYTSSGGNSAIVSPQVVTFEIAADGTSGTYTVVCTNNAACNATANYTAPTACAPTVCTAGQVGGQVFLDYNADGIQQAGETAGLQGITVKAYNSAAALVATTTSDLYGKYAFTGLTAASFPLRIEFSNLPTIYGQGTVFGQNAFTTTQFVAAANCAVNLGVLNPNDFCETNPKIFMPCYLNGDPYHAASIYDPAIIWVNYDLSGMKTPIANIQDVASVWGLAYNKFDKNLYSAAFLRRHVGLTTAGLGGIFRTNVASSTTALLVDVENIGVNLGSIGSNAARGVNVAKNQPSVDADAFTKVGKVGMGGIDVSEDGQTLYFVNLFEKKLHRLNIAAPTTAPSVAIPDPNCVGGTFRPWGVKVYKGFAYVTGVCDASTSTKSNLRAYVYRYNLATNVFDTNPVFDFPLTYPKGFPWDGTTDRTGWYAWTDDQTTAFSITNSLQTDCCQGGYGDVIIYPQPIFSDLEFDIDGSMVMGFADRFSFQTGSKNYAPNGSNGSANQGYSSLVGGDILRAYFNGNAYVLENNAKAGPTTGSSPDNNQGPGFGEFYNDNFYYAGRTPHAENSNGGIALKAGSGESVYSAMDPDDGGVTSAGGLRKVSNTTGLVTGSMTIYAGNLSDGLFSKSGGIGDEELGCGTPMYLQIGNYVWNDLNRNGVQDPNEPPLAGVTVELWKAGAKIAYINTNAKGEYYFSTKTATGVTWLNADDGLLPNTAYEVRILISQTALASRTLTLADATTNNGNDQNDSDATLITGVSGGTDAVISFSTASVGSVNHTYDFGFYCVAPTVASIAATAATCSVDGVISNDAQITVSGIANGFRYSYSTTGVSGLFYSNAIAFVGNNLTVSGLPNVSSATTYVFRIYAADSICYQDISVLLNPANCPVCNINAVWTQQNCNDNGTATLPTDDYFTITVNATAANGGSSNKYEVLLNGTVLNVGGTTYGTALTLGQNGIFVADDVTIYTLLVRSLSRPSCVSNVFSTSPVANCSNNICVPTLCAPIEAIRN